LQSTGEDESVFIHVASDAEFNWFFHTAFAESSESRGDSQESSDDGGSEKHV
jgi:hypothetical protein